MGLLSLGAGIAIGYVIGTKTGREGFERGVESVKSTASETWHDPKVQDAVRRAEETANTVAHDVADRAKKAAAAASEAIRSGVAEAEETVEDAADAVKETADEAREKSSSPETKATYNGDVLSDPGLTTERKGTDWSDEGGAPKPE